MATSTTKLGLTKPDFVDVVDITDLNDNADTLDSAVGFTVCTNATRPASPYTGQSIFETDTGDSFIWDGSAWQPGGGGGSIEISPTAPSSPAAGDLWWDSDNGNLYIYYTDADSSQWVAANGPQVFVGTAAPAGYQGQMWFDSSTGKMYVYYDDGSSAQWVSAIGGSLAGSILQVVSTTKTNVFSTSSTSFVDITDFRATITPSATSSKILVFVDYVFGAINTLAGIETNLVRNSTLIAQADSGGATDQTQSLYTKNEDVRATGNFSFLDSPSTTSSTTYKVEMRSSHASTVYVNRGNSDRRSVSTITVMEIAG